jgi:cleavage and polyadenylation specificity factor subunit 2
MVDGKIVFSAGSTVPVLESSAFILPDAPKDEKPDEPPTSEPAFKTEPDLELFETPSPAPIPRPSPYKPSIQALPGSLFVGDLRLPLLKARLAAKSIPAEFAGQGVLICGPGIFQGDDAKGGSIVAVRKVGEGQVSVEGGIGRVWEEVRREVMGCFARVVAV